MHFILNSKCLSSPQKTGSLDAPQSTNLLFVMSRMALSDSLPTQTKQSIGDLFLRDHHLVLFRGGNILLPSSMNLSCPPRSSKATGLSLCNPIFALLMLISYKKRQVHRCRWAQSLHCRSDRRRKVPCLRFR